MKKDKLFTMLSWGLRGVAAIILLQTLFFKFSGARESVYIFSTLGIEPWGRIGSGVFELIASVLLMAPRTVVFGAAMSLVTVTVAIASHLAKLGIKLPEVGDQGELFALAIVVWICSAATLYLHRREIPILGQSSKVSAA